METRRTPLLFAFTLASALGAQDPVDQAIPDPKTPQHERLAAFEGHWRTETEMAAMPGVPGMEEASTMSGTEEATRICGGLWLHVSGDGTCNGEACTGLWLLGYDPYAKTYQCLVASSMDDAPCSIDATYDEETEVWHFRGESSMGKFRSEFVFETPDRSIETCYAAGEDGVEKQFMRTVRTRIEASDASADGADRADGDAPESTEDLPPALAALHADCGTWDCEFEMAMPGMPASTSQCREVVTPICGGKWTWSTFTGDVMGMPFEGHALTGYDSKADKVVSFWIDSMTGASMRTDGSYDAESKTFSMTGRSYDENGELGPVSSEAKHTGEDTRTSRLTFGAGDARSVLTLKYRRADK